MQGGKHLPENLGDKPFVSVLLELKSKPTGAKKALSRRTTGCT